MTSNERDPFEVPQWNTDLIPWISCDATSKPNRVCDNLPKTERDASRQLKQRHDIIIKSADKGSATVIMDRSWYINESNRQLLSPNLLLTTRKGQNCHETKKELLNTLNACSTINRIDQKTKQYLVQNDSKPGRFWRGVLSEKLGGGVRPASQNPYPIYDQNLRFSLPCLWPDF